jgi:NAD(P)-dependent dehydrogenase (short-subunit alcohol dehydrogenase family)
MTAWELLALMTGPNFLWERFMLEIKDAVAVVTGGASGIGLAFAKYRVRMGGGAFLGDISVPALQAAKASLGDAVEDAQSHHGRILPTGVPMASDAWLWPRDTWRPPSSRG